MAAGDAGRVWFPELVRIITERWMPSLQWKDWILLRDQLDAELKSIRSTRGIRPPMFFCPSCRERVRGAEPSVSVRAMILALGRFGIIDKSDVKTLEKKWELVRREHKLDLYGKPTLENKPEHACE